MDLATRVHAQRHGIALVSDVSERAHSAIDADSTLSHTISVMATLTALHFLGVRVHICVLTVEASVVARKSEDRPWQGVLILVNAAKLDDWGALGGE